MNRSLVLPVLLAVVATASACNRAEDAGAASADPPASATTVRSHDSDAELAEITSYRLRMDEVERWYQAQRNVYEAMRKNPALTKQLENEADDPSLDELEARFEAVPEVRRAIESAGLEVRDFTVIIFTLAQAGVANAAVEAGASRDSVLARTGVDPANLDFVREHKVVLERMQAEVAALAPDKAAEDGDEDGE